MAGRLDRWGPICSDFRVLLNSLCSCLKRKNKKTLEVFLKPLVLTGFCAGNGPRLGRRGGEGGLHYRPSLGFNESHRPVLMSTR